MIIGETLPIDIMKNNFRIDADNPLKQELFSLEEIIAIKEKYNIQKVIITHIEEYWGLSHTDLDELSKSYDNVVFAFDGMTIDI